MKRIFEVSAALVILLIGAVSGSATVLLDQTSWTTGTRTSQSLPTRSAWFGSSGGSLTVVSSALRMVVTGSSGMGITYFTTNGSAPVQLNVGDTLTTTFHFNFNGVPTNSLSSQGFKIGIFDFADGSNVPLRVTNDGSFSSSSQGLFVQGYSLFGKMYTVFGDNQPIDIRKRTNVPDSNLLGASADWTSIGKTPQDTNSLNAFGGGFTNGTPYTLQFVFQRSNLTMMAITETWSNLSSGATLSVSTIDTQAVNFSFDGIAFRPQINTQAPATNNFTEVKVEVTSSPVPASIITDPQDLAVASGHTATFTAVPNGTLPLFYQWYYNTNTVLPNATNSTFTITNAQPSDQGGYSMLVSNAYGSATSAVAQLIVATNGPSIDTQPQDVTVIPGQSATFNVSVSGSLPLTYQWYYNTNSPLADATNSTFSIPSVQPSDAGTYSVLVSNPVSAVTSSYAVLTVNTNPSAPVFITQPAASLAVKVGNSASFTAAAVGTQPITYQWNLNNVPITNAASATATTLTLTNVQTTDAGSYTLTASNSIGSTISSAAVLTVVLKVPLPIIPTNSFNVTSYGAVGDGTTDNAGSIQSAINAAASAGGGTVEVPSAGTLSTYLSGPIVLSNSVNLQIDSGAMLQMLPMANWPGGGGGPPFITGMGIHDVEISGSGTIDGQGAAWWACCGNTSTRPDFIHFSSQCQRVLVQDVTLQNPPIFHLMLKGENVSVTIQRVTINTSGNSPNTDGMDLASTNVLVNTCTISDGDDNIEIGGSGDAAADITITNCTFGFGHGVSFGSDIQGGAHDVLVSNCTFNGTDQGIRFKSDRTRGGLVQNLQFRDLTMSNVGYAVILYDFYDTVGTPSSITPTTAANNAPQPVITTTPIWQNILISNVTATALTGSRIGGILWARQEMPVTNFTLQNVNIVAPTKTFCIYSARGIQIIDSNLGGPTSTNSLTLYNAQVTVTNSVVVTNLVTLTGLVRPGTNNNMAFFNTTATIDTNALGTGSLALGSSVVSFKQNSVNSSNNLSVSSPSTLSFTGGVNVLNGPVNGSGDLLLNVPASTLLTLQSDNSSFAGALVVSNSGTVLINNTTGSGTGTGAVTVVSGATLGGTGTIGGPVTVNGALAPGSSPGTLTVSNNLTASAGAALQYQLGTSSDLAAISGNLTLGGTLNIADAGGFTTTTYTLFTYSGTLLYNGLSIGATPNPSFTYTISTNTIGQVNLVVGIATPPPVASFTASLLSGAAPLTVSFTDTSSGSPSSWFWTFGDGGTSTSESPSYTYSTPGTWTASLIASNAGGASSPFTQTISVYNPFAWWQLQYFGSTNNNPNTAPNGDYTGAGMSNTNKFMAGFNPTNSAAFLHIISAARSGANIVVTYLGANGDTDYAPGILSRTNVLDFTTGDARGSYTNGGWQDTFQTNILSGGTGLGTVTNMTDAGGATNVPSRYYRVRVLLP